MPLGWTMPPPKHHLPSQSYHTIDKRTLQHHVQLIIIYMQKFLHFDWQWACQFIPNSAKTWNFLSACRKTKLVQKVEIKNDWHMQKELTNQAFWLVNDQRNSQIANQLFCFQIKRMPWMAQLMAQFFLDRVIHLRFVLLNHLKFFSCILLISAHVIFCAIWNK